MIKIFKKYWLILLVFVGVPLLLVISSYIYIRIGYKKPIFAVNYSSNKILNGKRYDGMLFTTIYCKDGTNKVTTRFTKYECSKDRIFTDGYYENDLGVMIEEEYYNKYLKDAVYYGGEAKDIDDFTQDYYDGAIKLIDDAKSGNLKSYAVTDKKSEDGYWLLVESESEKWYCRLGTAKDSGFILGDYVDGKCVIPDNITDYIKEGATLYEPLKSRITCSVNE